MSWLSSAPTDPNAPTLRPVITSGALQGALTAEDTVWACETNKGFTTETQSWYSCLADGSWIMVQIIFSVTGIMFVPPTVQFVFKRYDPKTKKSVWKSINMTNWKANGQGGKSDQAEIKYSGSPTTEEVYNITANLDQSIQVAITFTKPAETPGFKIGDGDNGGKSFFGSDAKKPDGYVVHRFQPVVLSSGHIILDGAAVAADGEATFIHAVQGMRPNLIARRWNFAFFASPPTESTGRVRAIQMEFETNDEHGVDGKGKGRNKVNVGAVVVDGKYQLVTSQVHVPNTPASGSTISRATHIAPFNLDSHTGYKAPSSAKFEWSGASKTLDGEVKASIESKTGSGPVGENGLIEKVDVLSEIPYIIRKVVGAVGGIKPFIYQHFSDAELRLTLPGAEEKVVQGSFFDELTFICD